MQTVSPFLWFDGQAEEAANFYVSIFKNSKVEQVVRNTAPGMEDQVMIVTFTLDGQQFAALNGGPRFKFNEAISFVAACDDQAEVDRLWAALSEGGETGRCGWLKDRYGVSWQVFPSMIPQMLAGDAAASARMSQAMMPMTKLDIAVLKAAYDG